ncbi:peptide transporter [Komagataeibacter rhaeticus]|uniref:tetratricopeptide repeat protein n=1 Tax=Komagataeibacter rhaeticus TaxID=215221 RepID=UPI0004D84709|nr:tetratricopeptide repeat protein [Komagataeibacter rhaeticus]KDU96285.1 peptide transporter [Komagataeibacter rhaeticus AF1]MBL7240729.1 tetratricopeptide repeat protein [Komagataeibacter rhaeticus]PYD54337.1 peptide transporter [Komagataeibacter rhaeticus]GBQ14662.1 O-linked N-acetylglucosamine transferase [Komagataeibacter rhaeticus DSM 16663]
MSMPPATLNPVLAQALQLLRLGRFAHARAMLENCPASPRAEILLAHAHAGCNRVQEAARLLCRQAAANPGARHPAQDMLDLLLPHDRVDEAEAVLRAIRQRAGQDIRTHDMLGELLLQRGRTAEAQAVLADGLALSPAQLSTGNLMAVCLMEQGEFAAGRDLLRYILQHHPDSAMTHANLAHLLGAWNRNEEALQAHGHALSLRPEDARLRLNHALTLLKTGRMAEGWAEYEWRRRLPGRQRLPEAQMLPVLAPDADLRGRTILITREGGLGDMLMMLRFVPVLAGMGARVSVQAPDTLHGLIRRMPGIRRVVDERQAPPPHDWHCPFLSLPHVLHRTQGHDGQPVPYLRADPALVRQWAPFLPMGTDLRVGLVWGGASRPDAPAAFAMDRRRSLPLRRLAPLAGIAGISLVSLQMGTYTEQLRDVPAGMRLYDPMESVRDMDDTAALIAGLDVVVSVDTSVAHLAGAMGCPVLLLDRFDNCWRWRSGRTDSPWYPGLRIIRQIRAGEWENVVHRLCSMLARRDLPPSLLPARG